MARGVLFRAATLSGLPPGTRVAFRWLPRPESAVLDLAIQTAGLVSVPVTDPASAVERGARAWAGDAPPDSLPVVAEAREMTLRDRPAGGVLVDGGTVLDQKDLLAAAERLQKSIAPGGGEREIVVAARAPESRADRELLAWATVHGAAVLLAPGPESLVGSAVWARPTLFHGSSAELAAFRRAVEQEKRPFWDRRAGRLPFGRLRTVLWSGEEEPSEEDLRFWKGRGVRVGQP
jgi:hypothetical protein